MQRFSCRWLLPAACAVVVSTVHAQDPPRGATPPDPLDPGASVPPLVYRSTLSTYRRPGADQPVPWRDANATVGRIGGWRAYAREAAEPLAPEPTEPAAAAASVAAPATSAPSSHAPAGLGGHKMH